MIAYETLLRAALSHFSNKATDLRLSQTTRNAAATLRNDVERELIAAEHGEPLRFLEAFDVEPERTLQHTL